jgi:cell wall-associated NlpC family hydrolase
VISAARRYAPSTLVAIVAALLVAGSAVAQPPSIGSKRAEAQAVLAQIRTIDSEVSRAAEAWNLANIELAQIAANQQANGRLLVVARTNLGRAQQNLNARLVAIYTGSGRDGSTLEVLLGATSLEDLVNRLDTVERVSNQDAHVLDQVRTFRAQVQRRRAELATAHRRQANVVTERAAQRAAIEAKLAERQRLLSSIQSESQRLEAAEQARQAELERQARARLRARQQAHAAAAAAPPASTEAAASPPPFADNLVAPGAAESAAPPPARYGGAVGVAMQYLGTPYVWGGSSPGGFDCSGFVMYVFAQIGISLPHNAAAQYGYGSPVSRDQLEPGDLVFFDGLGHNGIYIGGGQFVHSPHTGDVVKISSLSDSWYASTFVGARRL